MAATYPGGKRTFSVHTNITEIIDASHPNSIQEEVAAMQAYLGTNPHVSNAVSSSDTFTATSTTYSDMAARMLNIEKGIVADAHSQYIRNAPTSGSPNVITTPSGVTTVPSLVVRAQTSQTANLQEWKDASGNVVVSIGPTGTVTGIFNATAAVTTKGDLLAGTGAGAISRLGVGSNGQYLVADSSTATGLVWSSATDTTKIGLSTITTAGDTLYGTGAGAVTRLGIGTNGAWLSSNGSAPVWATSGLVRQTNGTVSTADTTTPTSSGVVRNIFVSTSAPTSGQGADGDIWIQYS
jgi:hypothetical protein